MRPLRLLAVAMVLAAACAPPAVSRTEVGLYEFGVETGSPRWQAGQVELEVANRGQFPHTLVLTDEEGRVVAATRVLQGEESTTLRVALDPGTYQVTCRIVVQLEGGQVIDHYQEGMRATVEVVAPQRASRS